MTPNAVSIAILVLHWLIVLVLSVRVVMRRPAFGVSIAWIAVIMSVPFAGATAYLLFAERRLGRRRSARMTACVDQVAAWQACLASHPDAAGARIDSDARPIQRHAERVLGFPALCGNDVELFEDASAFFGVLIQDIDRASRNCHLCFYIWSAGGQVDAVLDALARAAERGVECRALGDALGSKSFFRSESAQRLRRAGVVLIPAMPTGPLRPLFVRRDLRNHRKIVAIDNCIAYTGSHNLVDPHLFKQHSGVGEWVDAIARITGPAAVPLGGVFALDWALESGGPCELPSATETRDTGRTDTTIQVVPSGPGREPEALHQLLLAAIYSARRTLILTTPYFVPDETILTALISASLRGVKVTLIVPARIDSLLVRYASVSHFDDLLSAGVRIARFQGGLLHTKSLTVDDEISVFGSVNLDMRSIWLNFEISLFVYDADFTSRLTELQESYLDGSDWLDLDRWRQRSTLRQFTENAFRLASPFL